MEKIRRQSILCIFVSHVDIHTLYYAVMMFLRELLYFYTFSSHKMFCFDLDHDRLYMGMSRFLVCLASR